MATDKQPQPLMEPAFAPPSPRNYEFDDQSLPAYRAQEQNLQESVIAYLQLAQHDGHKLPITHYPHLSPRAYNNSPEELASYQFRQKIVSMYFNAIQTKNDELIALLIQSGLVTTETTDKDERTPLLAAVEVGNLRTVQQLMDFDANVNAYGVKPYVAPKHYGRSKAVTVYRTPLQRAAETGNLAMTRLLMETYHADDSQIAPDGQHALRLAASHGHREIVQYLPARRGGGWRRWKVKHRDAVRRIKKAGKGIYKFFKVLLWTIPKYLLWYFPKYTIVIPLIDGARWLREHHRELPAKIIRCTKRVALDLCDFIRRIPSRVRRTLRFIWDLTKRTIKRTPAAIETILLWFWQCAKACGVALGHVFASFFSFLHTVFTAIVTFFRHLTLGNILEGLRTFMRAIFVDVPRVLWSWLCKFGEVSEKVLKALFGTMGCILTVLASAVIQLFVYVPRKLGAMVIACFQSLAAGCKEVMIWYDPKRA